MRVIIANPPGYGGPDYDDHLCSELGALGVGVELVTSRFRFGDVPDPVGYRRRELFYPLSSRLFRRSGLRVPLKVAEHPLCKPDPWLRIIGIKCFLDGGMLTGSAYMREPWGLSKIYSIEDPNYRGVLFIPHDRLVPIAHGP